MANLNLKRAGELNIVQSFVQAPTVAKSPVGVGQIAMIDSVTGKTQVATSANAAGARAFGMAISDSKYGNAITLVRVGIVDGYDLSALDYNAPVYLGVDGNLSDTAGAQSVVVGRVFSGYAVGPNQAPSKLLWVEIN